MTQFSTLEMKTNRISHSLIQKKTTPFLEYFKIFKFWDIKIYFFLNEHYRDSWTWLLREKTKEKLKTKIVLQIKQQHQKKHKSKPEVDDKIEAKQNLVCSLLFKQDSIESGLFELNWKTK